MVMASISLKRPLGSIIKQIVENTCFTEEEVKAMSLENVFELDELVIAKLKATTLLENKIAFLEKKKS